MTRSGAGTVLALLAHSALAAACATPPAPAPTRAEGSLGLSGTGWSGQMLLAPLPVTAPLPGEDVADAGVVGHCTIRFASPGTRNLPAHVEAHLERRVAAGTDPCRDPNGFTAIDLQTDYGTTTGIVTIDAERCATESFHGTSVWGGCWNVSGLGLVLAPEDPSGDDMAFGFSSCLLTGPTGTATLGGTIILGPCRVE